MSLEADKTVAGVVCLVAGGDGATSAGEHAVRVPCRLEEVNGYEFY